MTQHPNIAFCFLLRDTIIHKNVWEDFFKNAPPTYNIYAHIKEETAQTPEWIIDHKIKPIQTGWCKENLVWAFIKLLKEALKDNNQYFVLISGECIPLYTYEQTYRKIIRSKKSRVNPDPYTEPTEETGLMYADQWVLLNRKHAKLLTDLKNEKGREWLDWARLAVQDFCPDELYPINWFIHNYGKIHSPRFLKEFRLMPTTYTLWDDVEPHPIRFTTPKMLSKRKDICKSGALFARKFNHKSAKILSSTCAVKIKKSVKSKKSVRKSVKSKKSARKSIKNKKSIRK